MHGRLRIERDFAGVDRVRTHDGRSLGGINEMGTNRPSYMLSITPMRLADLASAVKSLRRRGQGAMSIRRRAMLGLVAVLLLAGYSSEPTRAFALFPQKWDFGVVTMHLQLGTGPALLDGRAELRRRRDRRDEHLEFRDRLREVAAGRRFQRAERRRGSDQSRLLRQHPLRRTLSPDELAVTTRWFRTGDPSERVEADIVFNTAFQWNSYRGRRCEPMVTARPGTLCGLRSTSSVTCSVSTTPTITGSGSRR